MKLLTEAIKFKGEINKFKKNTLEALLKNNPEGILDLEPELFAMFKNAYELVDRAVELTMAMAETMEEQNGKLDMILANTKRES